MTDEELMLKGISDFKAEQARKKTRRMRYASPSKSTSAPVRDICRAVETVYGLNPGDLMKRTNGPRYARPRQMAMYLVRVRTGASFPAIGKMFGRDHSTVFYGCEKAGERLEERGGEWKKVAEIDAMLAGTAQTDFQRVSA